MIPKRIGVILQSLAVASVVIALVAMLEACVPDILGIVEGAITVAGGLAAEAGRLRRRL